MQLDDVAVVGLGLGAVEALDVGVRDLDDRHALVVAQRVQPLDVLPPEVEGVDVALAVPGILDRAPALVLADARVDQRLQPVDAVDHQRPERVLLGVEGGERLHDLVEGPGQREVGHVERAEAVLGQDEHRVGRAGGEGGLADAVHAVDQDPRRLQRRRAVQGGERDGHYATSGRARVLDPVVLSRSCLTSYSSTSSIL